MLGLLEYNRDMAKITQEKARELRDRAHRSGITWCYEPSKEGSNWCFPFRPAGHKAAIQAIVLDRELNTDAEELIFINDIEEGVGLANANITGEEPLNWH